MLHHQRHFTFDPRFEPAYEIALRESLALEAHRRDQILGLIQLRLVELKSDYDALRRKYSPNQPRVPAGNSDGGQWTSGGGGGGLLFGDGLGNEGGFSFATYTWGKLVTEFETGFGKRCVYRFDFGTLVMPGPIIGGCWDRMLPSGASHGYFLNDNWSM
jgi:hypothetical protein